MSRPVSFIDLEDECLVVDDRFIMKKKTFQENETTLSALTLLFDRRTIPLLIEMACSCVVVAYGRRGRVVVVLVIILVVEGKASNRARRTGEIHGFLGREYCCFMMMMMHVALEFSGSAYEFGKWSRKLYVEGTEKILRERRSTPSARGDEDPSSPDGGILSVLSLMW